MFIKGFKFGMLLQFAIGPMCLLVFNTAGTHGFSFALELVFSIAFVDALYILLSVIGVASIIKRENVTKVVKIFGCIVLVVFGSNMIVQAFGYSLLPNISMFSNVSSRTIVLQGILLTASNPLTIIFWSGVFSSQLIENKLTKFQLFPFAFGCVMATVIFLTFISLLGSLSGVFLSKDVIKILNVCVGIIIIYFGIKLMFKK